MNISKISPQGDAPPLQQSYAQWVRKAIALARTQQRRTVSFYDSTVPEPRDLLKEYVHKAVGSEFSRYYTSSFGGGNPFILDMLAEGYGVSREQALCTTGATTGIGLVIRALTRPSDHVLIETPGFDLFTELASAAHLEIGYFRREGDTFAIDVAAVEQRLRPDTKLIILSNLHNPSGMALDHATMVQLAALAQRYGAYLVVDEVYADYATADQRPCPASRISDAVIVISSLTKNFGLASLRCGWVIGAREPMAAIRDLNNRLEFGLSNLTQSVAAHVLAEPSPFEEYTAAIVQRSRPQLDEWFGRMKDQGFVAGTLPPSGCICFPRLSYITDTDAFSKWMIENYGILVAPGDYFGAPGHIRIGFAQDEDVLRTGLAGLADGLRRYRPVGAAG